jgi:hypothetical protein
MYFNIDCLSFSFPFPPPPSSIVLLQTHFTYKFVYDQVCFCIYVYLSDLPSTYERKHAAFVFLSLAYFT